MNNIECPLKSCNVRKIEGDGRKYEDIRGRFILGSWVGWFACLQDKLDLLIYGFDTVEVHALVMALKYEGLTFLLLLFLFLVAWSCVTWCNV